MSELAFSFGIELLKLIFVGEGLINRMHLLRQFFSIIILLYPDER